MAAIINGWTSESGAGPCSNFTRRHKWDEGVIFYWQEPSSASFWLSLLIQLADFVQQGKVTASRVDIMLQSCFNTLVYLIKSPLP